MYVGIKIDTTEAEAAASANANAGKLVGVVRLVDTYDIYMRPDLRKLAWFTHPIF